MFKLNTFLMTAICTVGLISSVMAETAYPESGRPIRVIVGFSAGGGADASARIVTKKMGDLLGTTFVVENHGGAGGVLATTDVVNAKPDGYTLLWNGIGGVIFDPVSGMTKIHDPFKALMPITQTATLCNVLVVGAKSPLQSLPELLAKARANPGKLNYGTPGVASAGWISMQMLGDQAAVDMVQVPYKGGHQVAIDVASGQLDAGIVTVSTVRSLSGRIRPIAVTSAKRDPALPNVPTFSEGGVKGYNAEFWFGMLAPKGTPVAIVRKLNEAARQALTSPEVIKAQLALGFVSSPTSSEEFKRIISNDVKDWAGVLQKSSH